MFRLLRRGTAKLLTTLIPVPSCTLYALRHGHVNTPVETGAKTGADSHGGHRGSSFAIDPSKLDLGLQLDKMDFGAMVAATSAAISIEKRGAMASVPATTVDTEDTNNVGAPTSEPPGRMAEGLRNDPSTPQSLARCCDGGGAGTTTVPLAKVGARSRYTLTDMLRDCVMNGNWAKAYRTFEEALRKACTDILRSTAGGEDSVGGAEVGRGPPQDTAPGEAQDARAKAQPVSLVPPAREVECMAVLHAIKQTRHAALTMQGAPTTPPSTTSLPRSVVGIMRWHASHFYFLLRVLLEADRHAEVMRVWGVMEDIGFVAYEMDERTLNALIALFHRHEAQSQTTPQAHSRRDNQEGEGGSGGTPSEQADAPMQRLILALDVVAKRRGMTLEAYNQRVVAVAKAAQLLQRQQVCGATASGDGSGIAARSPCDGQADAIDEDVLQSQLHELSQLTTADFNTLLRTASGEQMTQRILGLMARLHVALDSDSYASLITALHTPGYVLQDDSSRAVGHEGQPGYEQHKDQRIARARCWFEACAVGRRTAGVYNAMLYILRSVRHAAEFDTLLSEWRGNAVRTTADRDYLLRTAYAAASARRAQHHSPPPRSVEVGVGGTEEGGGEDGEEEVYLSSSAIASPTTAMSAARSRATDWRQTSEAVSFDATGHSVTREATRQLPPILPPQWSTPPDGKTYELLIQRARYLHDWRGVWQLYEEMGRDRVRGTLRLYQRLIKDAKSHPPQASAGRDVDTSQLVMRIYQDMQSQQLDVTSLESTITLLNAWSSTRRGRRWT